MRQEIGLFWHVHHDVLFEFCFSYSERAKYIRSAKPVEERKLRLRLFKPVKNLPKEVSIAWSAFAKSFKLLRKADLFLYMADQALYKAKLALDRNDREYNKAERLFVKASQAHSKATGLIYRTSAKYLPYETLASHMPDIEKLHKKECPNCPWNGKTIFPNSIN